MQPKAEKERWCRATSDTRGEGLVVRAEDKKGRSHFGTSHQRTIGVLLSHPLPPIIDHTTMLRADVAAFRW